MARQNVRILPFINTPAYITSIFWEDRGGRPHRGVDLSANGSNVPLYSMCNGTVILKAYDSTGYGNYIIMKDSTTKLGFLYAHMSSVNVVNGDTVTVGMQVGIQGRTGSATGNHLHLEMQDLTNRNWIFQGQRSDYINPADWIPYVENLGDNLYYEGTPIPPTPSPIQPYTKSKFPWVLYANNLRKNY
jgi:murein DD-endopeptidase MepM/ murein hydrolase activator NlpD